MDRRLEDATAGAPPTKSRSRTRTSGGASTRPRSAHDIEWRWVKGHAGDELNERADELAREGMTPYLKAPESGGP